MCGRYDLSETGRTLRIGECDVILTTSPPRYNIAPLQRAPVVRGRAGAWGVEDLRWGLIPGWARDEAWAARCINARSETVAVKPMFRSAFRDRRCVVPADGYYEWEASGGRKLPWRWVRRDRGPLLLAGLWESWVGPGATAALETFTILTTEANRDTAGVHPRMPVILEAEGAAAWLDAGSEAGRLQALCVPLREGVLEGYRVSTVVNNSRNDVPECVRPEGEEGRLL